MARMTKEQEKAMFAKRGKPPYSSKTLTHEEKQKRMEREFPPRYSRESIKKDIDEGNKSRFVLKANALANEATAKILYNKFEIKNKKYWD